MSAHLDDRPGDTGSAPTDAYLNTNALLATTLLEAARRRHSELPGLDESLQDDVLVTLGSVTRRGVAGWFSDDAWCVDSRPAHEIFVNANWPDAGLAVSRGEDVLVTLLHEACHLWAQTNNIRDTSRDGRYHNRRFAQIAVAIGLQVDKDPRIGHRTDALSAWGRLEYGDLVTALNKGLALSRAPVPEPDPGHGSRTDLPVEGATAQAPPSSVSKYIFASCQCSSKRGRRVTIRVAAGLWRPGVICCVRCQVAFASSPD